MMTPNQSKSTKNLSARESLHQFSEAFYVKHKTDVSRLGASKAKCKSTRIGNVLWSNISKLCGQTKINLKVK